MGCVLSSLSLAGALPTSSKQGLLPRKTSVDNRTPAPAFLSSAMRNIKPASVCDMCWGGLFSKQLGMFKPPIRKSRQNRESMTGGFSYVSTWEQLHSRALAGCRWCQLVFATHEEDEDSSSNVPLTIAVGSQRCLGNLGTPGSAQDLSVFINGTLHFFSYVYTIADNPAAVHIVARNRILDVGSPASLVHAKVHIEECSRDHQRCTLAPSNALPPLLPTRLIDCSDPNHPRLFETHGEHGVYIALSYVWGEPQPHSTTTSNISTYRDGIDISCLPKTILDAIRVTHALGIRYLWADTLCIIQNSDEDKRNEISRMLYIYRDAYITVIAASAPRVGLGFLEDRPAVPPNKYGTFSRDVALPFICPFPTEDAVTRSPEQVGEVWLSPIWTYSDPPEQPSVQYDISSEPISSRGWCMQEYLMSPRALVFTSHTLQFHCQTAIANVGESYHQYGPPDEQRLPDILFLQDPPIPDRGSTQWKEVRKAWQAVVRDYTQRSVTVAADKLLACGGVAEEFHRVLCTDYLAGLWRDTLLGDLLWSKRVEEHIPRPADYRAPSWSWASVDGRVEAGALDVSPSPGTHVAEVVRCDVVLERVGFPFGKVTGGTLVLRTPLLPCVWNVESPNYLLRAPSLTESMLSSIPFCDDSDEVHVEIDRVGIGYVDSQDDQDIRGVWAAPVHWSKEIMAGLVLGLDHSNGSKLRGGHARYRRVGYFNTHADAGPVDWVDKLQVIEVEIV